MKVSDIMTKQVIGIGAEESVEVAERTLTRHNIGALPVCSADGKLCGMVTDRDLVTRCVAANKPTAATTVRQVMSTQVHCATPDMAIGTAAHLMGRQGVRRLPVVENGKLCGMLSLGDIACYEESSMDAADALTDMTENLRKPYENRGF